MAQNGRYETGSCSLMEWALRVRQPAVALGDVPKARGMTDIARKAGVSWESLYRALSTEGNPGFATILKVVRALGPTVSVGVPGNGGRDEFEKAS
jgi:probable addiction module antidote protein